MRLVKIVDFRAQLLLIIGGILLCVVNPELLFYPYFIVGGWQVLSCMTHMFLPHFYPYSGRKIYLWVLLFVGFAGFICVFLPDSIISYLFILLIISPLMAIWYCFICYKEVKLYQQKEWIQLK
jgi:hypothetical protein